MKVLVATTGGTGHFHPVVPFARACEAAGHQVRVAAPSSFAQNVTRAGFEHLPFADADQARLGAVFGSLPGLSFDEANEVVIREVFGRLDAGAALPELERAVRDWRPDLVLRETAEVASYVVAEAQGVPHVQVDTSLTGFVDYHALFEEPLVALGAEPGMDALRAAPRVSMIPEALEGRQGTGTSHRFRPAEAAPLEALPDWWPGSRNPLVYATLGTVTGSQEQFVSLHRAVVDALAGAPVRVLLTTGSSEVLESLGTLPAHVHAEAYYPQAAVMPHAAAMIGHGGLGTTLLGLAAGVPMVVLPLFADQPYNAARVAALGASLVVPGGADGVSGIGGALQQVLDEDLFRIRAREVEAEVAGLPPVTHAVSLLERWAGG
jgi:glycosyltransferase